MKQRNLTKVETLFVYGLITEAASLLGRRCALCHRKFKHPKGWLVHHEKYKKGEKRHGDFDNRLSYYEYLLPIIRKEKNRFKLLENPCHQAVTRLNNWKPENRKRLYRLACSIEVIE